MTSHNDDTPAAFFDFAGLVWDVRRARQIAASGDHMVLTYDLSVLPLSVHINGGEARWWLQANGTTVRKVWPGGVTIENEANALEADLDEPLIFVQVDEDLVVPIWNWDAIFRATRIEDPPLSTMSAILLSPEEEKACRIEGQIPSEKQDHRCRLIERTAEAIEALLEVDGRLDYAGWTEEEEAEYEVGFRGDDLDTSDERFSITIRQSEVPWASTPDAMPSTTSRAGHQRLNHVRADGQRPAGC